MLVALGVACSAGSQEVPAGSERGAEAPKKAAPAVEEKPAPAVAAKPAEPPAVTTLVAGPDRYQLPQKVRCDEAAGGPFCGVHVVDMAARSVTTLVSRDGVAWTSVKAKKKKLKEVATSVEFVAVPRDPALLERTDAMINAEPGAVVGLRSPHPLVPEAFTLPEVRTFLGDFVAVGERLYAAGYLEDLTLLEIDPKARTSRAIVLAGKTPVAVLPGGEQVALYLAGKRDAKAVALFDAAAQKVAVEIAVPRDLEPECKRKRQVYGEDAAVFVAGRFYVGFSCKPDT